MSEKVMILLLLLFTLSAARSDPDEIPRILANLSLPIGDNITLSESVDETPLVEFSLDEQIVWGEWTVDTPCTDTCGSCGHIRYIRECICEGIDGCPCSESESRTEVCGTKLCSFPRHTCCEGFKKTLSSKGVFQFECALVNETKALAAGKSNTSNKSVNRKRNKHVEDTPKVVKKAETPVWGEWTITTPCTESCGGCGKVTHTRQCLCTGKDECPCSQNETRVEVCGTTLCQFPRRTCCVGYKKVLTSSGFKCASTIDDSVVSSSILPPIPSKDSHNKLEAKKNKLAQRTPYTPLIKNTIWGDWTVVTPCTDTCGSCGLIHYKRECLCAEFAGCPCSEHETRQEVCAPKLCKFPRKTCCKGYKKAQTNSRGFECLAEEETTDRWLREDTVHSSFLPRNHIIPTDVSSEMRPIGETKMEIINDNSEVASTRVKKEEASVIWGEWIVARPCTSDCGACGRISFTRECLCAGEEGCPCRTRESRVEVCATNMCKFPRRTCCDGFRKMSTAEGFKCVAEKESDERICTGTFTPWVQDAPIGHCSSTCGMCGKRRVATRTCGPEKCECVGDTQLFEPCGSYPCRDGKSCCEGYVKGKVNGIEECISNVAIPPALSYASRKFLDKKKVEEQKEVEKRHNQFKQILPVLDAPSMCTWGNWTEVDSACSSSCGMCGVRVSARRNCHPIGCNCVGPSTRYEDCGDGICEDKQKPCCGFYTKSFLNGVPTCIDPVSEIKEKHTVRRETKRAEKTKTTFSTSTCRGIWSPFTASLSSSCDSSCGLCGHRSVAERQCIPQGCTCEGSNKLYERCGEKPCWNKPNSCCDGASVTLVDGKRICKEDKK